MKIAVVAGSAPPLSQGGVASAHYQLFRFLRASGFDAKLFTHEDEHTHVDGDDAGIIRAGPWRGMESATRRASALWFRITEPGTSAYQLADALYWTTAARALRRNIAAFAPDVLVVPDRGYPLLWLDPPASCRVVHVEHHNPARFTSALLSAVPPSRSDVELAIRLGQRTLTKVSVVVCPARYMLEEFEKTFTFAGKTAVVPHVADADAFRAVTPANVAARLNLPAATPVVYIPAGGSIVKGERYAFALVQRLSRARPELAFFISGSLPAMLREELAVSGLAARVFAPGPLPWAENLAHAAACQLCLSPALAENFSMALLEALQVGLPVATFDVGGNRDLVDRSCGALVPLLDLDELAVQALRILGDSKAMAAKARDRAAAIQIVAREGWLSLVRSLAPGQP